MWLFWRRGKIGRRSICDPTDWLISTSKSRPHTGREYSGQMREQDDDRCLMRPFYSDSDMQPFSCSSSKTIFHAPSALFETSKDWRCHFGLFIHHHWVSQSANEKLSGLSSGWRTWSTCSTRRRRTSTRC